MQLKKARQSAMMKANMPALFFNLKIGSQEKFDLFKVTLADIAHLFDECHGKIRGDFANQCVEYSKTQFGSRLRLYQELPENDWVMAGLEMLSHVQSRSIFLYFEDHKLVADAKHFAKVLAAFDQSQLDYLCYSFFKASALDIKNLLPLGARHQELFSTFQLSNENLQRLGKISSGYCTYSLLSLASVDYFRHILTRENKRVKIYRPKIISVLIRLFPHPAYRLIVKKLNSFLSRVNGRLCISDPSSPFNLETVWYETILDSRQWNMAVLKEELFVNYDDDNGAYEESLIKRGLYPFDSNPLQIPGSSEQQGISQLLVLAAGESFDCTYYSHQHRIRQAPKVQIQVLQGRAQIQYQDSIFNLAAGESKLFYSNLKPMIHSLDSTHIEIKVFDEVLS